VTATFSSVHSAFSYVIALSLVEFICVVLAVVALIVVLYIALYEYKKWRERRVFKALVSTKG